MGYITSNQGRPIQGVSQQPEKTRLPGQCTLSDNFRPDIVRGLINRQGTEAVSQLEMASSVDNKWHYYDRGEGAEKYLITIRANDGKLRVFSPDGTEHNVTVRDNAQAGYLASPEPFLRLEMLTVADYTFIVNKDKLIQESATKTAPEVHDSIIYCQYMDYGQKVEVIIDGVQKAIYGSPTGASAIESGGVTPRAVIDALYSALQGGSGGQVDPNANSGWGWKGVDITADFTITKDKNTLVLKKIDGTDYTIKVYDDADNNNTTAIKGRLKNTTMLPGTAPEGFVVKIDPPGAENLDSASFYLKAENTGSDHVTWKETIAPGVSIGLNKSTMPFVLVRESISGGISNFTLRAGEWADRLVGDDRTNAQPTFVNVDAPQTIQSVGIFQNRLFFTSGESVIMSRSADFFNFYRETAQASLDTDPIDVFADVPKVNFLKHSVAFDGDLVFFSDQGQFLMDGSKPVTKENAVMRQATSYEAEMTSPPVASGDSIFFAFEYGKFTGIREFFTDSITDTKKARPITDHVKQYIKGKPLLMKTSTNFNVLVIKTDDKPNILYVYDWLWQGAEKVQSSWGTITFPEGDRVLYFEFVEELLWLVMQRDNYQVYVETVDMGDAPDDLLGFPIRLDRRQEVTFNWAPFEGRYNCLDPMPGVPVDEITAVRKAGAYPSEVGLPISLERSGAFLVSYEELSPNHNPLSVVIGRKYTCTYEPTNPVALDENGYALNLDRLTVGSFYMNYNTSGDVKVTVTNKSKVETVYEYNNRTLGGPENIVGFAPLVPGQHRTPVRQKSDTYKLQYSTDSYLPLEVRDFEYNGNMARRGRRL